MNNYINAQILNMMTISRTFEQACEIAAIKDDGAINREEEKALKKLKIATQKFRKELESIK